MERREFLKTTAAGVASFAMTSCIKKASSIEGMDPAGSHTGDIPTDQMTYRTTPSTGDRVSLLGYGMMRLPYVDDHIDQEEVNRLVKFALDHGVNYFDTSPAYCQGHSEESLGIALKASGYPRESYYIATKLSNFAQQQWTHDASIQIFQDSLRLLQVDYVDYLLLHAVGGGGIPQLNARFFNNGCLDYLLQQREKGVIRNLGFSYHGDIEVYDYLLSQHDKYRWDFVQIQLNYIDWYNNGQEEPHATNARYLYDELEKRNIPAVIMEPLLGGRLSKVPDHIIQRLKQRRPEDSVASWAFRFAGTKPGILTVLSGMTYMEHLQDNLRTCSPLVPLNDEEWNFLQETAELMVKLPTVPCTDCKYCMPCPYGVDIPSIFAHYNKCVNQGNVASGRQDPQYEEARRRFLIGYDRSVPRLRQASHCIGCGTCQSHCPQRINIPEQLRRIDEYVEQLKQGTL